MAELVPSGAWDTHIHVFDPNNFPYDSNRSYTPKAAQISEYPRRITACDNIVVVHASVQGSSPAALIDTLFKERTGAFKDGTLRGLATIDPTDMDDDQLDKLHALGVRGVRLHKMSWGHGAQSHASGKISLEISPMPTVWEDLPFLRKHALRYILSYGVRATAPFHVA